ncbi:MAG: 1-deoxy-D-xylulose-5-phosphate reductoisomerase [Chloroflexota bacterium]|nr:1-deoxy-D-xylulose-5-phosphate reductoisomerase [Chloroflexota bacterium]
MPIRLAILGSTGSIGRSTLEVVDAHPDKLSVVALAAGRNAALLRAQTERYRPTLVSLDAGGDDWRPDGVERFVGAAGLRAAATHPDADIIVVATSGHAAIEPTLAALRAGKIVALANKETIVCAGELVMDEARRAGNRLRPVDSEHSAVWQCLETARPGAIPERIILTASGGPFRTTPTEQLHAMTAADALKHPTWNMGSKITIDSATLMNKGLEMIEAHWLFDMPYDRIEVVVNPQSVIHSYIEYPDGSMIAQLGPADMRLPIQYALSYPERWPNAFRRADLPTVAHLDFALPDRVRFPALRLAREAGVAGNTYPTVLSAADEVAVARFLRGEIGFLAIPALVERALDAHRPAGPLTLESIQAADRWAREYVQGAIASG